MAASQRLKYSVVHFPCSAPCYRHYKLQQSSSNLAAGELSPFQKEHLSEEETATIYTARAILEGLMTREREAAAELESHGAGTPEPEPEGEDDGEELTTPVKTGLAFSFGKESPLFKIAEGIEDEEKILFEGKTAEIMTSLMPEILAEATTFLDSIRASEFGDVIRESLENSGSTVSAIDTSKTLAKSREPTGTAGLCGTGTGSTGSSRIIAYS